MPKVSVIIPTYNREKYVAKAIESALNQSFKNLEVIVVDDGSTDNTGRTLERQRNRIRYICEENGAGGRGILGAGDFECHAAGGHRPRRAPQRSWYRRKRWLASADMLTTVRWQKVCNRNVCIMQTHAWARGNTCGTCFTRNSVPHKSAKLEPGN
jgi:glycosyltransferase involved in cell wall biosynthesis